jgi:type I restriction-modification system DNA methylase subunit
MPNHLDITTLENWLWEAACKIRGPVDAPRYKDYVLSLVFLKRLSEVFDDEAARNDYNLSPSRYFVTDGGQEVPPLEEAMTLLHTAKEHRAEADAALDAVLTQLGLGR